MTERNVGMVFVDNKSRFKMAFVGDPHIGRGSLEWLCSEVIRILRKNRPCIIFILGDIFHKRSGLNISTYSLVARFVFACSDIAHTVLLVGNHDMSFPELGSDGGHSLQPFLRTWNVTVVEHPTWVIVSGTRILAVPYFPPGKFISRLSEYLDVGDALASAQLIVAHQEFRGVRMSSGISIDGDEWSDMLPPVISGHIHTPQTVDNIRYPGSMSTGRVYFLHMSCLVNKTPFTLFYFCVRPNQKVQSITDDISWGVEKLVLLGTRDQIIAFRRSCKYKSLIQRGVDVVFRLVTAEDDIP